MNGRYFLDSNIGIYLLEKGSKKQQIAMGLMQKAIPIIGTQVITENINVCIRKLRYSKTDAFQHAENLLKICEIFLTDEITLRKSFDISINYQYSYYDSLIIAAALLSNCDILYSEDMQHQQTIDNQLQIINPFII